ncbi:hypothetical protein MUP37_02925, partial [Candidatus Bathyarchaeota archaeon]|nr:hypothetical protein [Candidatus Bathyarchaeota archaeon]
RIVADGSPRDVLMSKDVESLGIGLPKSTRLFQMLSAQGIVLGQPVVSVEELAQEIRKLANR